MENKDLLQALNTWQGHFVPEIGESHLTDEQFYRIAMSEGQADSQNDDIEHLSLCAACQKKWVDWLDTVDILKSDVTENSGQICSGVGFLKAASASVYKEPVTLESTCGRFELTVYPDLDFASGAMLAVEALKELPQFEGRRCVVRDANGLLLVSGVIEDGRVADRIMDLASADLTTWTIVLS